MFSFCSLSKAATAEGGYLNADIRKRKKKEVRNEKYNITQESHVIFQTFLFSFEIVENDE